MIRMNQSDVKIENIMDKVQKIEGWLQNLEIFGLLHLPIFVDNVEGHIVEIGSYKGRSTVALALGSQLLTTRKPLVYAIDAFDGEVQRGWECIASYEPDFFYNIQVAGVDKYVSTIKKLSEEAYTDCPTKISALFIDGDHSYESVKHDIVHYASRVVPGGIIAFHDYCIDWPGVMLAVDEMCTQPNYSYFCDYMTLRLIRKLS